MVIIHIHFIMEVNNLLEPREKKKKKTKQKTKNKTKHKNKKKKKNKNKNLNQPARQEMASQQSRASA